MSFHLEELKENTKPSTDAIKHVAGLKMQESGIISEYEQKDGAPYGERFERWWCGFEKNLFTWYWNVREQDAKIVREESKAKLREKVCNYLIHFLEFLPIAIAGGLAGSILVAVFRGAG